MLKQVREAGAARRLVGGPDVVPDVDGNQRQGVVLMQDHFEPVLQRVLVVLERRGRNRCELGGGSSRRLDVTAGRHRHHRGSEEQEGGGTSTHAP